MTREYKKATTLEEKLQLWAEYLQEGKCTEAEYERATNALLNESIGIELRKMLRLC